MMETKVLVSKTVVLTCERIITFSELEGTGEGAIMAHFKVLLWTLREGTEEHHEKPQLL
jgi:hypothetical protein